MQSGRRISGTHCFDRDDYILRRCAGKSVLHVGCTCNPNFKRNLDQGTLLHPKLERVANRCIGIDIAQADIQAMQDLGYSVKMMDATDLSPLQGECFDLVLLADIIEHTTNPGAVLKEAMTVVAPGGEIVVTAPNAFGVIRYLKLFFRYEQVHSDHVAYYSSGTLTALAEKNQLQIVENAWYRQENRDKRALTFVTTALEGLTVKFFPWLGEGCIAVMKRTE